MFLILLIHICTFAIFTTTTAFGKQVNTSIGKVEGVIVLSSLRDQYVQKFLNIPYAEAPVGKLRLVKPEPKKYSNGTLNNNDVSLACWQDISFNNYSDVVLTEDCLILNIWTSYPQKKNQSVMVWFHGGGFRWGYGNAYPGYNLVAMGDVILVTVNYRLSFLGFPRSDKISGNLGLFDQRLAMKWIKENIEYFGGNPESVTIFGESAGAVSVSAHSLSQQSWPYFHRIITQSGNMLVPRAMAPDKLAKKEFHDIVGAFECEDNDQLLQCLQENVNGENLRKSFISGERIIDKLTRPYVDGDFIKDDPEKLLRNGNIKTDGVMTGITRDEGFITLDYLLYSNATAEQFTEAFQNVFNIFFPSASKEVYSKAKEFYKADEPFETPIKAIKPIVDFRSDLYTRCHVEAASKFRLNVPTTSLYQFMYSYASDIKITRPYVLFVEGTFGFVPHGVEVVPLFGFPVNNSIYPDDDQIVSMKMILYWTNFAKNGDPNIGTTKLPIVVKNITDLPYWPKDDDSTKYFEISTSQKTHFVQRSSKKCDFLKNPEKYVTSTSTSLYFTDYSIVIFAFFQCMLHFLN